MWDFFFNLFSFVLFGYMYFFIGLSLLKFLLLENPYVNYTPSEKMRIFHNVMNALVIIFTWALLWSYLIKK